MVATVHQDRCEWIKLISSTRLTRLVQDVLSGLFELELVQMFITKLLTHPDKLNLIVIKVYILVICILLLEIEMQMDFQYIFMMEGLGLYLLKPCYLIYILICK